MGIIGSSWDEDLYDKDWKKKTRYCFKCRHFKKAEDWYGNPLPFTKNIDGKIICPTCNTILGPYRTIEEHMSLLRELNLKKLDKNAILRVFEEYGYFSGE